jgi:fatty acid desaturase
MKLDSDIKLCHTSRRSQIQRAIGRHDMHQLQSTWYDSVKLQCFLMFSLAWYVLLCCNVMVSWRTVISMYLFLPILTNSLVSTVHELGHGHIFSSDWIFVGALLLCSICLPMVPFKILHDHHHRDFQHPELDFEYAYKRSSITRRLGTLNQVAGITAMLVLNPWTGIRGLQVLMDRPLKWRVASVLSVCIFTTWVYIYPIALVALLVAVSLHPLNSRIWREHPLQQDTMSSYSPVLRLITNGMCQHVEHHDFPWVDCHKLHLLKKLAPQYYTPLHHSNSIVEDFQMLGDEFRGR